MILSLCKAHARHLTLSVLLCTFSAGLYAQSELPDVSLPANEVKKFDHYIGVQVNPLLRQILSFSDVDDVSNPFLIRYTLRNRNSGLAFNLGGGVSFDNTESEEGLKTNSNTTDLRAGIGFMKPIGRKFEAGIGLDAVYQYQSRETTNLQVVEGFGQTDSLVSRVRSTTLRYGGGLQASLMYHFSERLLIGTELTWYFTWMTEKFNAENDRSVTFDGQVGGFPDSRTITVLNEKNTGNALQFTLPVALYLILKF